MHLQGIGRGSGQVPKAIDALRFFYSGRPNLKNVTGFALPQV
jgi:hypothetical protein